MMRKHTLTVYIITTLINLISSFPTALPFDEPYSGSLTINIGRGVGCVVVSSQQAGHRVVCENNDPYLNFDHAFDATPGVIVTLGFDKTNEVDQRAGQGVRVCTFTWHYSPVLQIPLYLTSDFCLHTPLGNVVTGPSDEKEKPQCCGPDDSWPSDMQAPLNPYYHLHGVPSRPDTLKSPSSKPAGKNIAEGINDSIYLSEREDSNSKQSSSTSGSDSSDGSYYDLNGILYF